MLGVSMRDATMHIEGTWSISGSIYRQTRTSTMDKIDTVLDVDSDDDPKLVAAVLRMASAGCYAEQAILHPVPINETVHVNGTDFRIDDYPAETIARPTGD